MQGVVRSYDPTTGEGVVVINDAERSSFPFAADALARSIFRVLRQGQRVVFDLDAGRRATNVRTGAEIDMGLPTAQI